VGATATGSLASFGGMEDLKEAAADDLLGFSGAGAGAGADLEDTTAAGASFAASPGEAFPGIGGGALPRAAGASLAWGFPGTILAGAAGARATGAGAAAGVPFGGAAAGAGTATGCGLEITFGTGVGEEIFGGGEEVETFSLEVSDLILAAADDLRGESAMALL
jgi:hypothetical protein